MISDDIEQGEVRRLKSDTKDVALPVSHCKGEGSFFAHAAAEFGEIRDDYRAEKSVNGDS